MSKEIEGEVTAFFPMSKEALDEYKTPVTVTYEASKVMGIELHYVYIVVWHETTQHDEPHFFFDKRAAVEWAEFQGRAIADEAKFKKIEPEIGDPWLVRFYVDEGNWLTVWEKKPEKEKNND